MTRAKNLLGKGRKTDTPYAIFKGYGPFGETEMRLLKTYQLPAKEKDNQYARWFVTVKSEVTYGGYDMGDSYIREATMGLTRVYADPLYLEQYGIEEDDKLLAELFS